MVIPVAIATTQIQTKLPRPKGALRGGKYYIKTINGFCNNCRSDKVGCCMAGLQWVKDDFQLDFASLEDVIALLETDVICAHLSFRPTYDKSDDDYRANVHFSIKARCTPRARFPRCVFWTSKGCRLRHNVRPRVCRTYRCYRNGIKFVEVNKRDKDRSNNRRWIDGKFSTEEIQTIAIALSMTDKNYQRLTYTQYKNLDWDSILTVLQGKP